MPLLKTVEEKIQRVEGFKVVFMKNGKDVHGNTEGIPQYPYVQKAKNNWTVEEWKNERFKKTYPGFDVKVLDSVGLPVVGQKTLASVRGE